MKCCEYGPGQGRLRIQLRKLDYTVKVSGGKRTSLFFRCVRDEERESLMTLIPGRTSAQAFGRRDCRI